MALLPIQWHNHKVLHKLVWMWLVRCSSLKVSSKVLTSLKLEINVEIPVFVRWGALS